jgi:hypothetical protein
MLPKQEHPESFLQAGLAEDDMDTITKLVKELVPAWLMRDWG